MITFPGGHLFFMLRQKQFMDTIIDFLDASKLHTNGGEIGG